MTAETRGPETDVPIVFELGARLKSPLNGSMGMSRGAVHAENARRKQLRFDARVHLGAQLRKRDVWAGYRAMPWCPALVTITRIAPRKLDDDNLAASAKSIRDGLADAMGINDGAECVRWRYAQEKRGTGEYAVRIEVTKGDWTWVPVEKKPRAPTRSKKNAPARSAPKTCSKLGTSRSASADTRCSRRTTTVRPATSRTTGTAAVAHVLRNRRPETPKA